MNSDATEAALGLLGLSPLNAPQSHLQPQPHTHHVVDAHGPSLTSTSVGVAVDRTCAPHIVQSPLPPPLVPLKRKLPSPALATTPVPPLNLSISRDALSAKPRQASHPLTTSSTKSSATTAQRHPQQRLFSPIITSSVLPQTPPGSQLPLTSPTSQHLLSLSDVPPPPDSEAISCICGFTYDDGFSIACDDCSRWCHAACFGIVQGGEVPEIWKCWVCDPTVEVDKERAVKIQKGRLKAMRTKASHGTSGGVPASAAINGVGGSTAIDEGGNGMGKPVSRRKTSPGAERKSRRGSAVAAAIEGSGSSRKKRRASILSPFDPSSPSVPPSNHSSAQSHAGTSRTPHFNGNGSAVSSTLPPTPVTFPPDIYPNPSVYAQLLRVAKAWRGVTALNPPLPFVHPPPKTYSDGGYTRVDSQGYQDRYGYSMSPLDNTTPVILDENARDMYVPRTVLRTDLPSSYSNLSSALHPPPSTCTPAHLRPLSPQLHVAQDPSPLSHASIYPSPPISNYMSPTVPSSSHPRPSAKSPLTPSTNIIPSSNPNGTIPATTLLAPYTATVIPSAAYLADPLNGYAHLGMGKPQVRLVGGGWGVGLDARGVGETPDFSDTGEKGNGLDAVKEDAGESKSRWARCGCWPNAVVRPVICGGIKRGERKKVVKTRHKPECAKAASNGSPPQMVNDRFVPPPMSRLQGQQTDESSDQDDTPFASDSEADSTTLSFALFALRDLRADEEIVLGWEWDDGHAVHMLPALMESPGLFAPAHLHHLRAQFTSILHALSSTFTTCACGSSTRDCAVRVMENVVEGRWPWPGGRMSPDDSEDGSSDMDGANGEWDDGAGEVDVEGDGHLNPRPGRNWGLGMNVDMDTEMDTSIEVDRRTRQVKRRKARKKSKTEDTMPLDDGRTLVSGPHPKSKAKKAVDLGPLVGAKRGFRTREKEPMNGGWGGMEIVPSSLKPSPVLGPEENIHLRSKAKGKARVAGDDNGTGAIPPQFTLPPRMRKVWTQLPTAQSELGEDRPRDHSKRAESWRSHERWRSPPEANPESPLSASGIVESSGKGDATKAGPLNGVGEDGTEETEFDTETEVDGLDDTRQMPPPPMPASLDPTTVSSLAHAHVARSSSPHQKDKNGVGTTWVTPQTPTMTSASSGRSNYPLNSGTAVPVPPVSNATCSPAPSPGAPPPSTPSSHPIQAQDQSDPLASLQSHSLLSSSVSPSATFSKLSLHSPNTLSQPRPTDLFSASTLLSSASSSTQRSPDFRVLSPLPRRPSKSLHVHPQNEPFSSSSLSAPIVTLNSPDSMRDTPAETRHQQLSHPSSESQYEKHPLPNVDRKCFANGEAYRVRFASPEILRGFPRLKGKATGNNLEATDHGASVNPEASGITNQQVLPMAHDPMDVDSGAESNEREDHSAFSQPEVTEDRTNRNLDEIQVFGSPCGQSPSERLSDSLLTEIDGTAPENHPSPLASVDGATLQGELMSVDTEPVQSAREPSPPAQPKVKMSLKDFALRKKKQREEEMAAKALYSPVTPDIVGTPSSLNVDLLRDFTNEEVGIGQPADASSVVNGRVAQVGCEAKGLDPSRNMHDAIHDFGHTENTFTAKCSGSSALAQVSFTTMTKAVEALQPESSRSPKTLPCVLREKDDTNQMQKADSKPPKTFTAKAEILDATLPSGPVGTDDCAPDVVRFAPEPPPPPLTAKKTSEITTVNHFAHTSSVARSIAPADPPTSAPTSTSTSTSASAANSRSNSVGFASNSNPPLHSHFPASSSNPPPSRRPSHEDGEITSCTPPKAYLPRSHTPPTQPRSFHATHPPSPNFGPTPSSTIPVPRRPAPLLSRSSLSNSTGPTTPSSSRPLPSGPRALRGSMTQSTHTPPHPSSRPPYAGSQYIPRGPSADRDRIDRDRGDRQWTAQTRPRGRAGSNGWGR